MTVPETERLRVIGTRAFLRKLDRQQGFVLPYLKLGVATYLKTHAGKVCTIEELAAWVYPAGPWARPDNIARVLRVVCHRLRGEGAPVERKCGSKGVVVGRYGAYCWTAKHVG